MFALNKTAAVALALVMASTGAFADGTGHDPQSDNIESATLKTEDRVFVEAFGPVQFADAFGSRETGPHGTYGKFPGNFETPAHIHSHGYRAVVLEGQMTNPFEGEENPPVMGPGSYWAVTAGDVHTTACVSDEDCVFLMWGDSDFDFVPHEH